METNYFVWEQRKKMWWADRIIAFAAVFNGRGMACRDMANAKPETVLLATIFLKLYTYFSIIGNLWDSHRKSQVDTETNIRTSKRPLGSHKEKKQHRKWISRKCKNHYEIIDNNKTTEEPAIDMATIMIYQPWLCATIQVSIEHYFRVNALQGESIAEVS